MSIDVFPLFSTPLYKTTLNYDLQKILKCFKSINFECIEDVKNGYKSENTYILDSSEFFELKKEIQENINFFVYEILNVNKNVLFEIKNSWIIKHKKENWAQSHFHNHSLISGVFYIQVNEKSGSIVFSKPNHYLNLFPSFFDIPFETYNNFNSSEIKVFPKNGELLLFPSHLQHSVSKNESDEDRYCLAFNCFIKGTFGADSSFNKLEIK